MAKQTLNARLGLLGGISILGTSGIVTPYSTSAYRASIVQAINVASNRGLEELVLTTGGKSEAYAIELYKHLPEDAFIQMGDFVGAAIKHCAKKNVRRALIVGMMGKLSKMANGKMQTHAAGSDVNLELLAELALQSGGDEALAVQIRESTTARRVLELCAERGLTGITSLICQRAVEHCSRHAGGTLEIRATLVDFNGTVLGQYPEMTT
jgi:cobalt-precorrin-5B (C1)-methyltransferase